MLENSSWENITKMMKTLIFDDLVVITTILLIRLQVGPSHGRLNFQQDGHFKSIEAGKLPRLK